MRRVRITYPGAYHHVMNRGYDGNDIFNDNISKDHFLNYLEAASKKLKIRLLAYCIMSNHYHLVLENTTGKLSEFLKLLNGNYGMYYRKRHGGKGYVFQGRFKSTIIENEAYLIQSIAYLLENPVRAGIVSNAENYTWSSAACYFTKNKTTIVDAEFVNELFGTKEALFNSCDSMGKKELSIQTTEYGEVLGSNEFLDSSFNKFDRRKKPTGQSIGVQRNEERFFESAEKVIWEFKNKYGIEIDDIDTKSLKGKRLRGELLVSLKDRTGLTYEAIGGLDVFSDLTFASLRSIYRNMKKERFKREG